MEVKSIDEVPRADSPQAANTALEQAVQREADFEAKTRKAPGRMRRQLEQMRLFMRMLKEIRHGQYTNVPWLTVASFAGAILYFLNPFDLVPDFILGFGFLDDASVAALVVKAFRSDLARYCEVRGIDPKPYFGER